MEAPDGSCETPCGKAKEVLANILQSDPEITKNICSHSPKKWIVDEMAKVLGPIYIIFRAGWEVKTAHTMFEYVRRAAYHDRALVTNPNRACVTASVVCVFFGAVPGGWAAAVVGFWPSGKTSSFEFGILCCFCLEDLRS